MDPKRIALILIFVALVAAGIFFAPSIFGSNPHKPEVLPSKPTVSSFTYVAVATEDIVVGRRLTGEEISWRAWPNHDLQKDYITRGPVPLNEVPEPVLHPEQAAPAPQVAGGNSVSPVAPTQASPAQSLPAQASKDPPLSETPANVLLGSVVKAFIRQGEPIVLSKVIRPYQEGLLSASLDTGKRAVALSISPESVEQGIIHVGDHVDVVHVTKTNTDAVASTVMENLEIINMGPKPDDKNSDTKAPGNPFVVFSVTPEQAQTLLLAKAQGDLNLVLRSYADIGGGSENQNIPMAVSAKVKLYKGTALSEIVVLR